jgi:hypothetical protein
LIFSESNPVLLIQRADSIHITYYEVSESVISQLTHLNSLLALTLHDQKQMRGES